MDDDINSAIKKLRQVIADLGSENFTTEDVAYASLTTLGPLEALIRQTKQKKELDDLRGLLKQLVEVAGQLHDIARGNIDRATPPGAMMQSIYNSFEKFLDANLSKRNQRILYGVSQMIPCVDVIAAYGKNMPLILEHAKLANKILMMLALVSLVAATALTIAAITSALPPIIAPYCLMLWLYGKTLYVQVIREAREEKNKPLYLLKEQLDAQENLIRKQMANLQTKGEPILPSQQNPAEEEATREVVSHVRALNDSSQGLSRKDSWERVDI